jgi:hypothetical protein
MISVGSAMGAPTRVLPPALARNVWKPGQSGNPSGHSGAYGAAVRLAQQAAPYAMHRRIALMDSEDERVAAVACNSILDRAFGKPGLVKEENDSLETRIANMTREARWARMRELLEPMREYLHELDEDGEATTGVGAVDTHRRRRRQPSAT